MHDKYLIIIVRLRTHFSLLMINHNVMWFDISVHDPLAMTEVECLRILAIHHGYKPQVPYLQQLVDVVSDIVVDEFGVEGAEIGIVDILED